MNTLRFYSPIVFDSLNTRFLKQMDYKTNLNIPKTNITDHENNIVIEMSVPGFKKEQIEIRMEREMLTIKGNPDAQNDEDSRYICKEFGLNSFEKSFSIARTMNSENISAQFLNGILSVTIPKRDEQKVKTSKEIQII